MRSLTDFLWKCKRQIDRLESWLEAPAPPTCTVCGDDLRGDWIPRKHCHRCWPSVYKRADRPPIIRPLGKASSR